MDLTTFFWPSATLFALSFLCPAALLAQNAVACRDLDVAAKSSVLQMAARQFRTEATLQIEKETHIPGGCYTQLFLALPGSTRRIVVFLSPDQRFLSPALWDLSIAPQRTEKDLAERLGREAVAAQAPVLGPASAPVTVVVFSDFQCPYCASLGTIVSRYRETHPDTIRVFFRHYPLTMHEWAAPAARAAICISRQSQPSFWRFHDLLFSQQKAMSPAQLVRAVEQFISSSPELSATEFAGCMTSAYPAERLQQDEREARALDIHATPSVFINGRRYGGFRDDAAFSAAVSQAGMSPENAARTATASRTQRE